MQENEEIEINYCPHDKQRIIHKSDARFRVVVAGRRFGKTTLAVNEIIKCALLNNGTLSFFVAPTYRQAKMIAWRMLMGLLPRDFIEKVNETELSVELINKSIISIKGADNEDSLRGVGVKFVVIDEFGCMPNARTVWGEVLRPMLADTKGRALFIGTPKGQNAFYDVYLKGIRGEDGFKSWKFETGDNPFIDKAEIAAMERELPPTMYEQEVKCSFITDEESVLITSKMLDNLRQTPFLWKDRGKRIISCDPSEGGDACIILYLNNGRVDEKKAMYEKDTMKIAGEIVVMCNRHNLKDVVIDAVGIGKPIGDRVRELGKKVIYFKSSESALEEDRFYNRKAESWYHVFEKLRDKEIPYPDDNEIIRQLSAVRYKVIDSNGKIQLEPKQKTKERLGRSPDDADAYIQGIYCANLYELSARDTYQDQFMDRQGQGIPLDGREANETIAY